MNRGESGLLVQTHVGEEGPVYFAPSFSVGSEIGWRQTSQFPSSQEFQALSEEILLKVGPPKDSFKWFELKGVQPV